MIVSTEIKTICYDNNEGMITFAKYWSDLFKKCEFPVERFAPFLNADQFSFVDLRLRQIFDGILTIQTDIIAWKTLHADLGNCINFILIDLIIIIINDYFQK